MATYTWTQFKAAVLSFVTDRTPANTNFTAAAAEYVRARMVRELGQLDSYALHEKRYTSLRRGLAGFATTLSDADLRSAVKALLRDASGDDTMFNEAVAAYVRTQINPADQAAAARFSHLRYRLAGYTTAQNDATLQAAVKVLLRDAGADDTMFTEAVAAYLRMKLHPADTEAPARFGALRLRLAGHQTALSDSDLKTNAKVLLRDVGADNTMFAEAVAAYVRAQLEPSNAAAAQRFNQLRISMAGFQTSLSDADLKTNVRVLFSDGPRTNAEFARAVALFMRWQTAREVDARDEANNQAALAIANSCEKEYQRLRIRLAGFNHTLAGNLATEVNKHLPIESTRLNTSTYQTALIASAVEDLQAFGTWMDTQITTAKNELQTLNAWLDAQVATAKAELQNLNAWINAHVATAKAELQNLNTWLDAQISTVKDDLQALSDRVQKELRAGVIDLQHYIRAYQTGHELTVQADDAGVEEEGTATAASLPDGAQLREAYITYPDAQDEDDDIDDDIEDRANEEKCAVVAWADRLAKLVGNATCQPQIALDPKGEDYLVTPKLVADEIELRLVYDGLKLTFADADALPLAFDEDTARAVGYKINGELSAEWGESVAQGAIWSAKYTAERTRLYLKHRRKAEVG